VVNNISNFLKLQLLKYITQNFDIKNIFSRNIIISIEPKPLRCYEFLDCPENIRKKCWVYRLNLSRECWIVRKKAIKKFNWRNPEDCNTCNFYNTISRTI
jgi:hypothetical protein